MNKTIVMGLLILGLLFLASSASGQSLLDNQDYNKAVELQRQAEAAYAEGDYDKAKEYSEQAKIYIERSNTYVDERLLIYRANSAQEGSRAGFLLQVGGGSAGLSGLPGSGGKRSGSGQEQL